MTLFYRTRGIFNTPIQPLPTAGVCTPGDQLERYFREQEWIPNLVYGTKNIGCFKEFIRTAPVGFRAQEWASVFEDLRAAVASNSSISDQNWCLQIDLGKDPERDRLVMERASQDSPKRAYCTLVQNGVEIISSFYDQLVPLETK